MTITEAPTIDLVALFPDLGSLTEAPDLGPEKYTHIVRKPPAGFDCAKFYVRYAAENGIEVEALCGYRWVPRGLGSEDKPVCPLCLKMFGRGEK